MKPKVFITRQIPEAAIRKLEETCEVAVWKYEDIPVPRDVLEKEITEASGLFCMLTDSIDAALIQKANKLKVISNLAVGYNNIDIEAASEKGIKVTNTPGVLTETTADLTFALLMATARRITEASDFLRAGEWKTWSPMLLTGQDIYNRTLGIIGLGRIGEAIARRAKGFNMNVVYHNRSRKPEAEESIGLTYVSMDELLQTSDYVCIMTPYTNETKNLIHAEHFKMMKENAILINTARGGIVNEKDLYDALINGEIWAAGLDVFEEEPVPLDHPLLTLPNVVTLPHIGSASISTRSIMAEVAASDLLKAVNGETPVHLVNP
ncbi:2-hydroxyacid dehydrogenase [Cytobacillus gottheilii]|uniref:D-glycerate dehydrogenase n=1 Tax=Cytobacillus gottheilii TaxID=859144 RepID=A0ABX8FC96_9BACI|nr:D-glycerate dehydrogenase [Cytobacillus gottheilii]QVY62000.1 D-glycerate dehydrogenase [Cytobacillus gottheilii]